MEILSRFYSSIFSDSTAKVGLQARWGTPVRNIPETDQPIAVDLFRKLIFQNYPNSTDPAIVALQGSECNFKLMVQYFETNTSGAYNQPHPLAAKIEQDLLEGLSKINQKDEQSAFTDLKQVVDKFAKIGIPQQDISTYIDHYQSNPKQFAQRYPELLRTVFEYQTARAVYDTAVTQWAKKSLQSQPSTNDARSLRERVTQEIQNAQPTGLLDRFRSYFFGYKSTRLQMLEFRERNFFCKPQRLLNLLNEYSYLDKSLREAFNRIAKEYHVPFYGGHMLDVNEWLESPIDPREMPLELRASFTKLYLAEVEQLIKYADEGIEVSIPTEIEERAVEVFKDRAQGYFVAPPLAIESVQDIHDWLGKSSQALGIIPDRQWRRIFLIREFTADLEDLKAGKTVELRLSGGPVQMHKASSTKRVYWPDEQDKPAPMGTVKYLPPLTQEERISRIGEGKEYRAERNVRPSRNPKVEDHRRPEDRNWVNEGAFEFDPGFASLASDFMGLEKHEQALAMIQVKEIAQKYFGNIFSEASDETEVYEFLSNPTGIDLSKRGVFVEEFRSSLDQIMLQQKQRLQSEAAPNLTSRLFSLFSW
jgi:hypothetical protein